MTLREILERIKDGSLSVEAAEEHLHGWGFAAVGMHRLDLHRERRTAIPEVVFGLTKTIEQLVEIAGEFERLQMPILMTKVSPEKGARLVELVPSLTYDPLSQLAFAGRARKSVPGTVAVITAGSSDEAIAEEAAGTLEFFNVSVTRIYDAGVAGIHRLFASGERIAAADVLIVVAGMEGALPSVVGGLFRQPMIAVPTSVGYGASFQGLSALLTMMNSCAPGISVVNIDNGFGAAVSAIAILQLAARRLEQHTYSKETVPASGSEGESE